MSYSYKITRRFKKKNIYFNLYHRKQDMEYAEELVTGFGDLVC